MEIRRQLQILNLPLGEMEDYENRHGSNTKSIDRTSKSNDASNVNSALYRALVKAPSHKFLSKNTKKPNDLKNTN